MNKTKKIRSKTMLRSNKTLRSKKYTPVDFTYLLGKGTGFDDALLKIHFQLYNGLVGATNKAVEDIHNFSKNGVKDMVIYSSLQKQFSLFFNGMRLHEMYFGVMSGENMNKMNEGLKQEINKSFGSFDKWRKNFIETGTIPGVGFVALVRDNSTSNLMNIWINEFNIGELIGVDILLVMDMWEHAYIAEFGLNLKKYSETFLANVNWSVVSDNWLKSVSNKNNLYRD